MSQGSDKPLGASPMLSSLIGNFACGCIWKLLPCAACGTPTLAWAHLCVLVFKANILAPVGYCKPLLPSLDSYLQLESQ